MNAAMKITGIEAEVRRAPFAGEVRPASERAMARPLSPMRSSRHA
jgi:hypothetical protein